MEVSRRPSRIELGVPSVRWTFNNVADMVLRIVRPSNYYLPRSAFLFRIRVAFNSPESFRRRLLHCRILVLDCIL